MHSFPLFKKAAAITNLPPAPPAPATARKGQALRWLFPALLVAAVAAFWLSGFGDYLTLAHIQAQGADLRAYVAAHPVLSGAAYILFYTLVATLALPFASMVTLASGYVFGLVWGTILTVTGATIGATILFLVARSTLGGALRARAGPLYERIAGHMDENAAGYLLFLRLVPLFPFFVLNIAPALVGVKLHTYVWTTALGIIPGTAVYVNLGRSLGTIENPSDLVGPPVLLALSLLGLFALLPVIYRMYRKRTNSHTEEHPHE